MIVGIFTSISLALIGLVIIAVGLSLTFAGQIVGIFITIIGVILLIIIGALNIRR